MNPDKYYVCGNKDCMFYGDSTPAQYNRCMFCNETQVPATSLPWNDLDDFVKKVLMHYYNLYS